MASEDLIERNKEIYEEIHDKIMAFYEKNMGAKQIEVARALGICRSTVKRHLIAENRKHG